MKISIIIPVLNEESNLPKILSDLRKFRDLGHEIIVVDGGSADDSFSIAQDGADTVVASRPGRAVQMNCGAVIATGDVFLFLHADTVLPDNAMYLVSSLQDGYFWGYFNIRLSGQKTVFRLIEWMINRRSSLSSIATGDQSIFVEKKLFNDVNGFPEIELMEDIAISRLLKAVTAPACLPSKVITSSRRWENNGTVATVLLMWKLRLLYFFGVSPEKLSKLYR